jgi:hypothetical protein
MITIYQSNLLKPNGKAAADRFGYETMILPFPAKCVP